MTPTIQFLLIYAACIIMPGIIYYYSNLEEIKKMPPRLVGINPKDYKQWNQR